MSTQPDPPLEPEIVHFLERRHDIDVASAIERTLLSTADSATNAQLERIVLGDDSGQSTSYVVKRLTPHGDWIGRATHDTRVREHQLAVGGIYRSLPEGLGTAVLASLPLASGGFALLMQDIGASLVPPGDDPLTAEQLTESLRALARLHSTFYGFPARLTSGLGLCTTGHWLALLTPATAAREADTSPRDPVTPHLVPGWEAFARLAPEAWAVLEPLLADPAPVVAALRACPDTIVHGDAKAGNLAFDGERVLMLDWSQTLRAPGALDLGWYLAVNSARLPLPRDDAIAIYRNERARLGRLPSDGALWERELALGLLGGALRLGWAKALGASSDDPTTRAREQAELDFWASAALDARRWL